ncbi:hypothetical protein BDN71DRAFT_882088 [Pleurotus eryngii]|uniref:Uncharacterized protein n=1 Tax=Pleurotus eryngii TaxID=5323 RepID=A0A9P6A195_PLEER|nr:hypothetical protein BDN71DRAFT_882088 [Pleurotus eryngii]
MYQMHSYSYQGWSDETPLACSIGPSRPTTSSRANQGPPPGQYRPSTAPGPFSSYNHAQPPPPPPPPQVPQHPNTLRPGFAPSTTHRADIFFSQPPAPQANMRPNYMDPRFSQPSYGHRELRQHPSMQQIPTASRELYGFPLHRTTSALAPAPPPVPPKPTHHYSLPPNPKINPDRDHSLHSIPYASTSGHHSAPPTTDPNETRPNGSDDLALALALSQSEITRQTELAQKLSSQEDEDLARALSESMNLSNRNTRWSSESLGSAGPSRDKMTRAHSYTPGQATQPHFPPFVPSTIPELPSPIHRNSTPPFFHHEEDQARTRSSPSKLEKEQMASRRLDTRVDTSKDEELARMLANEDAPTSAVKSPTSAGPSKSPAIPPLSEDEALARRLAAEEELHASSSAPPYAEQQQGSSKSYPTSPFRVDSPPEAFTRKQLSEDATQQLNRPDTLGPPIGSASPSSSPTISTSQPILPAYDDVIASGASDGASLSRNSSNTSFESTSPYEKALAQKQRKESSLSVPSRPTLPRAQTSSSSHSEAPLSPSHTSSSPSSEASPRLSHTPSSPQVDTSPTIRPLKPGSATEARPASMLMPVNANNFVDSDLLRGVSIGFVSPSVMQRPVPMQGTFPNIINLPYGKCPPLHLQAPTWRSLLKLMARLSGTKVEPTIEGIAVAKHALHLRTVVQLVKPHHSAPDWRVVLWFKIDHPVPPNLPNALRYTNNDTSQLPYTFTLGSVPTILHDSDSAVSKYYVIPSTENLPFPSLPVTFPNLAMYLQAALEESRRYINDSSSGMRKLAKMVDQAFPNSHIDTDLNDNDERSGVGGLFKRVIGRGNKPRRGGGNEDTYELVTPFVPDSEEWG